MLKPRGFVPWGLPGPTRGRRDAAALASNFENEGDCSDGGGGSGWDPQITRLPFLGSTPGGLGHRN